MTHESGSGAVGNKFKRLWTHPSLINARFAQMTLHVVKLIALVVLLVSLDRHGLRDKLRMLFLVLLLLLGQILAGFDGDCRRERMR